MNDEKERERKSQLALASLHAQCEANGVAAVKLGDGELFMFSRKIVMTLIEKMDESGEDRAIIFVKTGPELQGN